MRAMKTCRIVFCAVFASVVIAYGGEERDASLERVKANFVRVLKDTNALVYSEIAKMGGVPPVADSNIRTVAESGGVSEKHVERLIRAQRADGSWPSVDYTTALRSQWPANEHLKNLKTLACARRTPETEQAFHKALGFWLNGRFRNPNWWWNQIGVPLRVGASALLMDDALTAEERAGVVKLMQESGIRMTGQNKVWLAECVLMRALLEGKALDARAARDAIASEVDMSKTVEGIQADWSFHQHGNMAQFGNYGAAYILSIARFAVIFSGTGLDFPDDKLAILENLLDKGFRPTVWRGSMDIGSVGRQFTENAQRLKGLTPLAASWWLARTGRPEAVRIFRDCRADLRGERAEVPHLGLTWFPNSAMGMYRTERWMAAVKCETAHIKGTERVNEDNLLGAHLADGALFTYVTGDEYRDIFPLWNWRHIPGTTSYDVDTVDWKSRNRAEDCAADGTTVHFTLDRAGLKAHTRWRFSPEGVDVSVTGITSARELPVVTTVEQSLAQPNAAFRREKDGIVAVNGAIRYELPSNAQVRIEERSGSWRRHMGSMPDQRATGRVFEITIPHGVKPSAASCAWRVRPCALSVP